MKEKYEENRREKEEISEGRGEEEVSLRSDRGRRGGRESARISGGREGRER